jgi:hypothetical protein
VGSGSVTNGHRSLATVRLCCTKLGGKSLVQVQMSALLEHITELCKGNGVTARAGVELANGIIVTSGGVTPPRKPWLACRTTSSTVVLC